ncbi:type II toxin-antitoxin system RelE/ParE family toxin [Polynucleobacter sp. IMCC30063]|uniref:type II toxin-antitoxin system RelE/ParE family toxin n=1 Tax=unclassified Polynucleobacter TaxID=2640945 RepID=UPI001F39FE09|nr:type II toxin-antitoxin system RelE/ParE family toxin [Polynucleobacter sp. IMCC30063]MCE7506724.1 type II toxin-antitoxin system RelE/ParE family toxin [Polynucleobacter sp. IMCC30063]MCE7506980.1 type II toxin-antitoxin system RelE/ParE family toxin [Polynucleobacter sp. IMCC30063]
MDSGSKGARPAAMRSALIKRNVKALTDGVYEMREKFGPGWRMYYVVRGKTIIVMLGGGDKSSQSNDIKVVKKLAKLLED